MIQRPINIITDVRKFNEQMTFYKTVTHYKGLIASVVDLEETSNRYSNLKLG
jgi:hypothetical protein